MEEADVSGPWAVVATEEFAELMTFLKNTFAKLERNDMATKNYYELPVVLAIYDSPFLSCGVCLLLWVGNWK